MARYIDLTLDKPRKLRFDVNALESLEQVSGLPLGQMIQAIGRASIRSTKLALWQSLLHEDRHLTSDRVGVLMQDFFDAGGELGTLNDAVIDALYGSGVIRRPEEPVPADPTPASPTTTTPIAPTPSPTG